MYTIHFTGFIPDHKVREFEQTIHSISASLNKEEAKLSMSLDMFIDNQYIVDISALNKETAKGFLDSEQYRLIEGCFQVLGYLKEKQIIENNPLNEKNL